MGEIAKNAGLNRESLYKALGETGNPEFGTVMRIVRALCLTLSAAGSPESRSPVANAEKNGGCSGATARNRRLFHNATAKQYCPSSSTVARHLATAKASLACFA
jgi:hypothetical protein